MQEIFFVRTPSRRREDSESFTTAYQRLQDVSKDEVGRYGIWRELSSGEFDAEFEMVELAKYPNGETGLTFLEQKKEVKELVRLRDIELYFEEIYTRANRRATRMTVCESGDGLFYKTCPTGFEVALYDEAGKRILDISLFWEVAETRGRRVFLSLPPISEHDVYGIHPKCAVPTLDYALSCIQSISMRTGASIEFK